MVSNANDKEKIISTIKDKLCAEPEVQKIVIFGSFIKEGVPNDIDIAVYQSSDKNYLLLALKYRKLLRDICKQVAIDVLPLKYGLYDEFTRSEIENGEDIFERRNKT